jgi:glycosyltransferase involved in cell wall biosynthesis
MQILFLDPYHGGSHAAIAEGYAAHSHHTVRLLALPPTGGWRWRMRGAAVTLARLAREQPTPDLLLATDMLDLASFRALTRHIYGPQIPAALYWHENQLTYPLPAGRARDLSFAWINYTSALTAEALYFNSADHRRAFLGALPGLLTRYHDYTEEQTIGEIAAKSHILEPGIDLRRLAAAPVPPAPPGPPIILWHSRWDYDKQPQVFFDALEQLEARGADFRLIVAGEHVDPKAPEFVAARERWQARLLHWGYAADTATYSRLLHWADIVVSTAIHESFGIGMLEALSCGCIPIWPRRLTYPDLLPPAYHADCLYERDADLAPRLHHALHHCDRLRQHDWRAIAAPYDWPQQAPRYDAALEALSMQHNQGR